MRNWKCPDSDTWDRFILDEKLPDRDALQKHLVECPVCAFLVGRRREEFAELASEWLPSPSSNIFALYPISLADDSRGRNGTLLAAQGQEYPEEITSVTLSSKSNEIFLKAIKDIHSGETWLYLLADDAEKYRGGLIKPFGLEKEYVIDAGGHINIGCVEWPVPDSLGAEMQFPDAIYTLDPLDFGTGQGKPHIFETPSGDRIEISVDETHENACHLELKFLKTDRPGEQKPVKIAIKTSEHIEFSHIRPIVGDRVSLDTPLSAGKIDIYLYGQRTGG